MRARLIPITLALVICHGLVCAQSEQSPAEAAPADASPLIDAFVSAIGGETLASVQTLVSRGSIEVVGAGITGPIALYQARPDRSYMTMAAPALGKVESGTSGDVVWELSDVQGPRLLQGAEKSMALRTASLDAYSSWRDFYVSAERAGDDTVDDRPCAKVTMTSREGRTETWWLDLESKLLVKTLLDMETPMGTFPVEGTLADYREVSGVKYPFVSIQKVMGQELRMVLESIEVNGEIDDKLFALPQAIQELLDRQQSEPAEPASETAAEAAEPAA
jgi:hypothetical protein